MLEKAPEALKHYASRRVARHLASWRSVRFWQRLCGLTGLNGGDAAGEAEEIARLWEEMERGMDARTFEDPRDGFEARLARSAHAECAHVGGTWLEVAGFVGHRHGGDVAEVAEPAWRSRGTSTLADVDARGVHLMPVTEEGYAGLGRVADAIGALARGR